MMSHLKLGAHIRILIAVTLVIWVTTQGTGMAVCSYPEWCPTDACSNYCACNEGTGYVEWCSECYFTGGWMLVQTADVYGNNEGPGETCPSPICEFTWIANCFQNP
jgi:hypothetical protein